MINVLKRSQAFVRFSKVWYGITCTSVVSTTAQYVSVVVHYTVENAAGGCVKVQAAPNVLLADKSSDLGRRCMPSGHHPRKKQVIVNIW